MSSKICPNRHNCSIGVRHYCIHKITHEETPYCQNIITCRGEDQGCVDNTNKPKKLLRRKADE